MKNKLINGDAKEILKQIDSESVDCIVTSPPYFNLRDYGSDKQIGLEESPELYISRLIDVFMECYRVLKNDGTLWINIADSYAGSNKGSIRYESHGSKQSTNRGMGKNLNENIPKAYSSNIIKPKDLIGIPWMLAFALRNKGWYLRQDIIWNKPNPMPESVLDRCTKSHEYIFLLSKSRNYYFDSKAISEPVADSTIKRMENCVENKKESDCSFEKTNSRMQAVAPRYGGKKYTENQDIFFKTKSGNAYELRDKRNKRSVWSVSTKPFSKAHFATFPPDLIEPCILAGCPEGGIVLDPFVGSGTTALVALQNRRNFIGIDINEEYIEIAKERIENTIVKLF